MSLSKFDFPDASADATPPRKRPAPFSIRLSAEKRNKLESEAGSRPLGEYIRDKLLGRRKASRVDYMTLGKVLRLLGESDQARTLCALAVALESR